MRSLGALLLLLALTTGARAGDVFVNGVRIYRLSNVSLEGCTVTFDAQGNVQVTAPGYEIRVQEPLPAAAPTYAPAASAAPAAPAYAAPAPVATPATPSYGVPAAPVPVATPGYAATAVAPAPAASGRPGFALTTWGQQTITLPLRYEVTINGKVVRAFSAADENLLIDLSPFLAPGANLVRLTVEYDSMYGGVPPTAADRYVVRIQFGRFNGEAFAPERALVEFPRDGTQMLGTIKEFQISL
jgi:hypothetical protein